jgi:hypothetical protein
MPITGNLLEIVLRFSWLQQECETVQFYKPGGAAFLTATPAGVGEAWWNDVKAAWRAMAPSSSDAVFKSVFVREYNGLGGYGEFPIPVGEIFGTRSATGLGDFMPPYVAAAGKLSVATNVTRPGQKRLPFALEGDNVNGKIQAAFQTLCNAVLAKYSTTITLGAPVATGVLVPQIVRKAGSPPAPSAWQDVVGYVLNQNFSTQNSRKFGHGS